MKPMGIAEQIHDLQSRIIENLPPERCQGSMRIIDDFVESATEYVIQTTAMETGIELLRFRLEGHKFRRACEQMDTNKRLAHDAFIEKLNAMNRLADELTGEPFYTGETDRWSIGNYAFAITGDLKCAC